MIPTRQHCPVCSRPFGVSCTRVDEPVRVRYLVCRRCNTRATSPEVLLLIDAPQQIGPGRPTVASRSRLPIPCLVSAEQ